MMDEHQSPSSNKKRKSAVALPNQKRCLIKNAKIPGNLAGTCALSRSPSKFSLISSPTSSNQAARNPSAKNAKAGPSTSPNVASCDLTVSTRVSSRVSRPTFKKKALSANKLPLSESDGTPPLSIIPRIPSPSSKQKRPTSSPTKRLAGYKTKRKRLDPNPIELTSSDDDRRPQPPRKRIKHTHKKSFSSEVINLCSESEDVIASPKHKCTLDEESVVVLSTDEEVDLEFPALCRLASRKINTIESPALPPLSDVSPPIEIESVLQASPPPLAHKTPISKPKAVSKEDGVTDENNICADKVDFPQGSLQVLYNDALARCTRKPRREKDISDQPSPFSSLKYVPPARVIRYASQTQSPSLHTPLFFNRIIHRLRARLKTLDTKAYSDARVSPSNPIASPNATDFSAISNDTALNSMEVSKLNKDQDTLTYPDAVMEMSAETILIPPIDFQDDTSSDTEMVGISPSIVNNMDVNERLVSRSLESDPVNYQIETTQEAEISLFGREDTQSFEELQRLYDVSYINEFSLHPALELIDTAKLSATFEPLSELPREYESITNTSSVAIMSNVHTSSASICLPEISIEQETTLNPSSPVSPSSKDDLECLSESPATLNLYSLASLSSTDTLSSRASSLSTLSVQSLNSSATIESAICRLLTPDDSPSPLTPLIKAQNQESLICSNPFPSRIGVSFDMDMSELNLQTIMCTNIFDEDDDDDISISGMELAYPEESHTI